MPDSIEFEEHPDGLLAISATREGGKSSHEFSFAYEDFVDAFVKLAVLTGGSSAAAVAIRKMYAAIQEKEEEQLDLLNTSKGYTFPSERVHHLNGQLSSAINPLVSYRPDEPGAMAQEAEKMREMHLLQANHTLKQLMNAKDLDETL